MIRDQDLEFFRPLWLRVAVTAFCTLWALFEWFIAGSPFWGTLAGACAIYCYYRLFLTFELTNDTDSAL